jgi:hypothetical protein
MGALAVAEDRDTKICGVTTRRGTPCGRPAGWGTSHSGVGKCKLHLGTTRAMLTSAARQQAQGGAQSILRQLGEAQPIVNAPRRLLELAGEMEAWVVATRTQLDQLGTFTTESLMLGEQVRAQVTLYTDATERLAKILVDITRLDLEARMVATQERLDDAQAKLVETVISAVLKRGGLDPKAVDVRSWVADELDKVTS